VSLGALSAEQLTITPLGRAMAVFPIAPRFAKMCVAPLATLLYSLTRADSYGGRHRLLVSEPYGLTPYTIAVVAALTVGDPSVPRGAAGTATEEDDTTPAAPAATTGLPLSPCRPQCIYVGGR
jgi:hypothetical protein